MTRREFRDLAAPSAVADAIASLEFAADVDDVPVESASGRTLARPIEATIDVPGFDRAAMDGYAVRASDTVGAGEADPEVLSVVDTVPAGSAPDLDVAAGEAAGVATGAVLPPGADAVVPVERTEERDETVAVTTAVTPGEHVMARGADVAAGDYALGSGTALAPRHVGLLAALGRETVPVRAGPRVAILSTGSELVAPGSPLDPAAGEIYDVNTYSLAAAVQRAGGRAVRHTATRDDVDAIREVLERAAADADLVMTSGSTSAGETDVLPDLVEEHGEVLVHGVALKPGRPLLVGRAFDTPFVGLPGYPVSALSVFREFLAPAIRDAAGQPAPADATLQATLATRVRYDGGRLRLLPVGLVPDGTGEYVAYVTARSSGATSTLVQADGVVRMAAERAILPAGEPVSVRLFDDRTRLPDVLCVGDPDPFVSRLLDEVQAVRFVPLAQSDARRWLADGVPDVLVADPAVWTDGQDLPGPLVTLDREWGLAVPAGDPDPVSDRAALRERDCRFASLDADLALRRAFDEWLTAGEGTDVAGDIDGYERGLPGLASAATSVARGDADVGLALRETADRFDLGFVSLGTQQIALVANPDRRAKGGVTALERVLDEKLDRLLDRTPGYDVSSG